MRETLKHLEKAIYMFCILLTHLMLVNEVLQCGNLLLLPHKALTHPL
jgi:hypothetical protein